MSASYIYLVLLVVKFSRTGLPLNSTSFAYDDLRELFASVAKSQANLTLPDEYLMNDISLLSVEVDQV